MRRQERTQDLIRSAAIIAAIDHMATKRAEEHAEVNAAWLKQKVTDAFTIDWNDMSLAQWLAALPHTELKDAPPWD